MTHLLQLTIKGVSYKIVFTASALRPMQSIDSDVRLFLFVLCRPLGVTFFGEGWRLLVKEVLP